MMCIQVNYNSVPSVHKIHIGKYEGKTTTKQKKKVELPNLLSCTVKNKN